MNHSNNRAVLLCRISSEKQASGYSMAFQERNGKDYAQKMGLILRGENIFRIIESSYRADRKKWAKFLERARQGNESHILVPKVDRCFRNFFDMAQIAEIPSRHGKIFHYFDDGLIHHKDSPASDILRLGIQGVVATWYVLDLAQKTKKGLLEKSQQGYWPCKAPMGYLNDQLNKTIVVDGPLRKWIIRIFELAQEEYSLEEIAKVLEEEGSPRKFSRSNIWYMIRNPIYSGWIEWPRKTSKHRGRHEPIVSQRLQEAAIKGLERFYRPKYNRHEFTYQGLIQCAECGSAVVGELKKGKFMYWHCTWRRPCTNRAYVREELLDQQFYDCFQPILSNENQIASFLKSLETDAFQSAGHREEELALRKQKLQQLRRYLNGSLEMKMDGKISDAEWEQSREQWNNKIETLEGEINDFENEAPPVVVHEVKSTLELAKELIHNWNALDRQSRGYLVKTLCSNCTLLGEKLSLSIKKPYDLLSKIRV